MTLRALEGLGEVDAITCESRSYLKRLAVTMWRFVFSKRSSYDVVFVGFFAQPILPLVRFLWRGPLVSDAFISLYDSLVLDKNLSRKGGIVARLALWLDRFCIRHSDAVLVDTLAHKEFYESLVPGEKTPPIHRMWASADELVFRPLDALRYAPDDGRLFEVLFWGGFIPLQGVNVIVKAAALLDRGLIRITIVGTGQTYAECRTLARSLGVDEAIRWVGWSSSDELIALARESHLLLGVFGETEKARRVIPNKAFQALALAKPLLTGRCSGISELLNEGRDVLLCEMGDPEDLAQRIEFARNHYDEALLVGANGIGTFQARASVRDRVKSLADVLRAAVEG